MTSQGTAHGRFQRAIQRRHLHAAEMTARELGEVSLAVALALTLLTAEVGDDRSPRMAARWLGRFIVESPDDRGGRPSCCGSPRGSSRCGGVESLAAETLRQLAATRGHATVVALLNSRR
jgi:hypothetical protein